MREKKRTRRGGRNKLTRSGRLRFLAPPARRRDYEILSPGATDASSPLPFFFLFLVCVLAVLTHNFEGNVKSPYSRYVCTSAVELKKLQPIDPKVVPLGKSFYIKGGSRFQDGLIACNVSREKNLLFLLAKRDTFSFGRAKYPPPPSGGPI